MCWLVYLEVDHQTFVEFWWKNIHPSGKEPALVKKCKVRYWCIAKQIIQPFWKNQHKSSPPTKVQWSTPYSDLYDTVEYKIFAIVYIFILFCGVKKCDNIESFTELNLLKCLTFSPSAIPAQRGIITIMFKY